MATEATWQDGLEIEAFLRTAEPIETVKIGVGVTDSRKVTLELAGTRHRALFKTFHRAHDSWKREVAAYELDKLLGLGMVPPTVERNLKGRRGCLQLWVEGEIMAEWTNRPPDIESWRRQVSAMWLFDYLTANTDRHLNNALASDDGRLVLIDNSRAFKTYDGIVAGIDEARGATRARFWLVEYDRNRERFDTRYEDELIERLRSLDASVLKRAIGRWVDANERRSLLERRDRILQQLASSEMQAETGSGADD